MGRPRLLDLFSGAGGAARGYADAGFEVVGVDIAPQPRYPYEFVQADALSILRGMLDYPSFNGEMRRPGYFDAIHASPTCQTRARATAWRGRRADHPDTLTPTLRLLEQLSVPWVVENVPEAAWDGTMRADLLLCGSQFGLTVKRHRVFQLGNWQAYELMQPCRHSGLLPFMHKGERAYADAMGCTWMNKHEARQSIPPSYTRWIGERLLAHLSTEVPRGR
ncbi:MAG TPA: hypothetical protein VFC19_52175 [Candidatus Limnocylindrales bacterium]|nr:hypothetical protein [Candidatus Limnocylindrales bacterium]